MKKGLKIAGVAVWLGLIASAPGANLVAMLVCVLLVVLVMLFAPARKRRSLGMQMSGGVTISLANGQVGGTLQTADGVCGMVLTGESESGGYTLGDTILVTGLASLTTLGITETNNPFAYRQVKEFYDEAGEGAELYLMLLASTVTVAQMADNTNASGAKKLINYAEGRIKVLGLMTDDKTIVADSGTVTVTNGLNASVYTAATNAKTMANAYQALRMPFRVIIGGTSYSGTASAITSFTTGTNNRVGILIGDTQSYDATNCSAALGLCLGRVASIPVQRKISRVLDGPLSNTAVFLKTTALASTGADSTTISDKRYITFKTIPGKQGFYFTGDEMLVASTDDYDTLALGRVIDKADVVTYATLVEEVDNEVLLDEDGNIEPGVAAHLETQVENAIELNMRDEISGVQCYIDPDQDILQTNELLVVTEILPKGYSSSISVKLGFVTKLTS